MRRRILLALVLLMAGAARADAGDGVRVVATIPDLADIAARIGGDRVRVDCLAEGTMNIHAVPLRPSALVQTSKADLFLEMGLSLEHAFVPGLLMAARNHAIEPGQPGFVNCSQGWQAIDVPATIDRGISADIHPEGNPHFNLDPRAGRHLAARVLAGLVRVDPGGREAYEARHAAYVAELEEAEQRWAKLAEGLAGKQVAAYHSDFDYFARAVGLRIAARIEPKPGVPPAPRDLAQTIDLMQREGVALIVTAKWSNGKSVRFVAEHTGARVLEIPVMVGGVQGADTWIGMMDFLHAELARMLAQ